MLSIVQSLFGVGLLLFGTPTLLLLGYSYSETLWLLLPCSVTISFIQVINNYYLIEARRRTVYLVVPTLTIGLVLVINYANDVNITRIVGVLLLFIGVIKFSKSLQNFLSLMARKYIYIYYIIIGMVHGISNMGGGPLSILMSTIYSKKEIIRANIAFIYLILAVFQLLVLFIMSNANVRIEFVLLIPVSLASYFFASKYISSKVNDKKYAFVLNLMILVYGILAIIK
jgi:uncharacterized membrane protein YfcA